MLTGRAECGQARLEPGGARGMHAKWQGDGKVLPAEGRWQGCCTLTAESRQSGNSGHGKKVAVMLKGCMADGQERGSSWWKAGSVAEKVVQKACCGLLRGWGVEALLETPSAMPGHGCL